MLDRFGFMDPSDGGRVKSGTAGVYYKRNVVAGDTLRVDGFVSRSLFDLFSDFTFYLNDPVNGDGIQQHDSRRVEGGSAQYMRARQMKGIQALLMAGANFTDSWIDVDLFHARDRRIIAPAPGNPRTQANVHIVNPAAYAQQGFDMHHLHVDVGLRLDEFRFNLLNRIDATSNLNTRAALSRRST